jgi:general secretion pathway protein I
LFRAAPPRINGTQAGFTIIEVLIALAVVAVCIVAIGSVMSTSARGVRSLEQHVTLIQTARGVLATGIPPRKELGPGVLSGQLNGHRWHIDVRPLDGDRTVPDADVTWIPQLIKIQVQSPSGGVFDLQTVRLVHRPAQ